jgi:uncharacterized protein (DUF1786 family)
MRILAIDMGTGTQDILVFDSTGPVENSIKMVMPSATQIAAASIRRATTARRPLLLTGVIQGGGPCHWALNDHLAAGIAAYATAEAARTFDDDLDEVARMGVRIVDPAEAAALRNVDRVELRDLDLDAVRAALAAFDVSPSFDGLALGCLDHGNAPPGYSDRLFRFDHLRRVVERRDDLLAFACLPEELPDYLTRARTMVESARRQDGDTPIVFLDTGPAAALGALHDPRVRDAGEQLVLNLGNMHALAFHLQGTRIISLYEHHTGEITREQIEDFSERLLTRSLAHEEVFDSKGHGVFYAADAPTSPAGSPAASPQRPISPKPSAAAPPLHIVERGSGGEVLIAVTGPQRSKLRGSRLEPYFATPHGDMMISGCFGLVQAFAEKHPRQRDEIAAALAG